MIIIGYYSRRSTTTTEVVCGADLPVVPVGPTMSELVAEGAAMQLNQQTSHVPLTATMTTEEMQAANAQNLAERNTP